MDSELECGICYRNYNAGSRCPRELQCKHAFCEKCLQTLRRPPPPPAEQDHRMIVCPLCRDTTALTGRRVGELRLSERLMEQLVAGGSTEQEEEEEEEEEEQEVMESRGRLQRTWRTVWRKIRGDGVYFTKDELRDLTMLSSSWF